MVWCKMYEQPEYIDVNEWWKFCCSAKAICAITRKTILRECARKTGIRRSSVHEDSQTCYVEILCAEYTITEDIREPRTEFWILFSKESVYLVHKHYCLISWGNLHAQTYSITQPHNVVTQDHHNHVGGVLNFPQFPVSSSDTVKSFYFKEDLQAATQHAAVIHCACHVANVQR